MLEHEQKTSNDRSLINIRKLAALDIVFHGYKFILIEFGLGVFFCGFWGVFNLFTFFHASTHPSFSGILGLCLSYLAINYVPLLLYAIAIVRRKSAEEEVSFELEHRNVYARKYTLQSLLLLLPLVVPVLAIWQELRKHAEIKQ